MAIDHISYSALSMYDQCPARYKAMRIEKRPELPSKALISGILVHAVVEKYIHELYESGLDKYPGGIPELVQVVFTEQDRIASTAFYKDVVIAAMTFAKHFVLDTENVFELEMKCEAEIGDGYPKLLTYIDLVERAFDDQGEYLLATDYKSGWATQQTDTNVFQLDISGWQLRKRFPDMRVAVRNYFVRTGKGTTPRFIDEWCDDNTVRRAKAIYDRMQRSYEKRDYPANPGEACAYCSVAQTCSVIQSLSATKQAIVDVDGALMRLREAVVLEAALKNTKAALKKYVDLSGIVELPDGMGAKYVTSTPGLTIEDLSRAYDALGDELWDILLPNGKVLNKYQDDPRLAGLWVEKPGKTTFKVGKALTDESEDE